MQTQDTPNVSFRSNSIKVLLSQELKNYFGGKKTSDWLLNWKHTNVILTMQTIDFVSLTYLVLNTIDIRGLEGQY